MRGKKNVPSDMIVQRFELFLNLLDQQAPFVFIKSKIRHIFHHKEERPECGNRSKELPVQAIAEIFLRFVVPFESVTMADTVSSYATETLTGRATNNTSNVLYSMLLKECLKISNTSHILLNDPGRDVSRKRLTGPLIKVHTKKGTKASRFKAQTHPPCSTEEIHQGRTIVRRESRRFLDEGREFKLISSASRQIILRLLCTVTR